jgi:hypothetical protein
MRSSTSMSCPHDGRASAGIEFKVCKAKLVKFRLLRKKLEKSSSPVMLNLNHRREKCFKQLLNNSVNTVFKLL